MSRNRRWDLITEVTVAREDDYEVRVRVGRDGDYTIIQGADDDDTIIVSGDEGAEQLIKALRTLIDQRTS